MAIGNSINALSAGIQGSDAAGSWTGSAVTQYQVQIGGSNNHTLAGVAVGTNGQLLIGSTGAAPVFATLGTSGGISITTGAGSLTINGIGGGLTWSVVTGSTQAMTSNNGYIANRSGTVAFTLPTTSAVGDLIAVTGINTATGWSISYTTNQQIFFGTASTTITSGSLASINIRDTVYLVCVTANLTWNVVSSIGNITVA